jgi:hypothetical protein
MRTLAIFLFFLCCLTMAIHRGDWIGMVMVMLLFLPFFDLAERYDHSQD